MIGYFLVGLSLTAGQAPAQPPAAPVPLNGPQVNPTPAEGAKDGAKEEAKDDGKSTEPKRGFVHGFLKAYKDEFCKDECKPAPEEPEKPRRSNPAPFDSPPFPTSEWQGYPNIGLPPTDYGSYPLMKGIYDSAAGDFFKDNRLYLYGWVTGSGNYSTSKSSNTPESYFIVPNRAELDQAVIRLEREPDTVQTDHVDWGFRLTNIYGIDYRYTTAGGYGDSQLLKNNRLYGDDPLEIYGEVYIPGILDGLNIRIGRYISPPDIEAQLAPDNYLASHSILFTYDNYTQTGILGTLKINNMWMVQAGINAGGDMAPWYKGAIPTGFFGVRWISSDNNDSVYTCLNDLNNATYRQFTSDGVPSGHDNYNYLVSTWTHRFSSKFLTATEAYIMWEKNAPVGGTPTLGPPEPFYTSVGEGPIIPGYTFAFGAVNYTCIELSKKDYITFRNEAWKDDKGERSGYATLYTSNSVGISHNFNSYLQVRPEIGYFRSYQTAAFDNGTKYNQVEFQVDVTLRF